MMFENCSLDYTRAAALRPRPFPVPAPPPPPPRPPASSAPQLSGGGCGGCCPGGARGSEIDFGGSGGLGGSEHVMTPSTPIGRSGGRARGWGTESPPPRPPRAPCTRALPHLRAPTSARRRLRQLRTWERAKALRPAAAACTCETAYVNCVPPSSRCPARAVAAPDPRCAHDVSTAERRPAA